MTAPCPDGTIKGWPGSLRRAGLPRFYWVFFTVVVSLFGTTLTDFSIGQWVFLQTHSVTSYSLIAFATLTPQILLAPVLGSFIDRHSRCHLMIAGHLGAGICSMALLLLYVADLLAVWHIILLAGLASLFNGLIYQTFIVSVSHLLSKEQLGRAQGLIQGSMAALQLSAPAIAAFMLAGPGLSAVFAIDIGSFMVAICLLQVVARHPIGNGAGPTREKKPLRMDIAEGWRYLQARRSLLLLLAFSTLFLFVVGLFQVLITPLVLSFATTVQLGIVFSAGGIGMLCGSAVMGLKGGFRRQIAGIFAGALVISLLLITFLLLFALPPSWMLFLLGGGGFAGMFVYVLSGSCAQVIWQVKIPKEMQGRVFGLLRMISQSSMPLAYLLAGPMADGLFEPLMAKGGLLAGALGPWLGVGPGRGISLLLSLLGLFLLAATLMAWSNPRLRNLEKELPDG